MRSVRKHFYGWEKGYTVPSSMEQRGSTVVLCYARLASKLATLQARFLETSQILQYISLWCAFPFKIPLPNYNK